MLEVLIRAFALMDITNESVFVDEILRGPDHGTKRVPDAVIVIHDDWVFNVHFLDSLQNIYGICFERKLRCVNADRHQAFVSVTLVPFLDIRQRLQTTLARVCPEVDQQNVSAHCVQGDWFRVEPEIPINLGHTKLLWKYFHYSSYIW